MIPKKIRITQAVNNLISDIGTKKFPVEMIIMFGSITRDDHNAYSDLDLCFVHEKELTPRQQREIESYFFDMLEDEVDLDFIYCSNKTLMTGGQVFEEIRKEGRVLYEHV